MLISVFTVSNHNHNLSLSHFCSPRKKACIHQQSLPIPHYFHALKPYLITNLLSISIDLPILDIPCGWIH